MKFDNKTTRRDIFRLLYPEKVFFRLVFIPAIVEISNKKKWPNFGMHFFLTTQ